MHRPFRLLRPFAFVSFAIALVAGAVPAQAQPATPGAGPPGELPAGATVVAGGLTNPRGMTWGADGTLYVALAGSGGSTPGQLETPPGPFLGGPTGAVVRIENGCPVPVVTGLPSTLDSTGGVTGVADVAILGGQLYGLVAPGTEVTGNPGTTNGVYQINADGTAVLIADYSAWVHENPPAVSPPEGFPNPGNPFAMVAGEDRLWVVDSVNGLVVTVTPAGEITLAADLSADHPVPTGIALAPEGGVYVGTLTAAPFSSGAAKVVQIAPDGAVTDVWTGLTMVTGVVVDASGTLSATEMSTGNTEQPPVLVPGSGRVVRQTGPDQAEPVATGMLFPIALDVGPDGALYVALPAVGADAGGGMIIRLAATGNAASPVAGAAAAPTCAPVAETISPPRAPAAATPVS